MARVLVCDDERVLRALVRATLEREGHLVEEARDGDEALALALARPPDLIILDMMMPGRTGLEVLRELRRRDGVAGTTPVVLLTARAQAEDREAAAAAGADRYLPKPFSPLELARLAAEVLDAAEVEGGA